MSTSQLIRSSQTCPPVFYSGHDRPRSVPTIRTISMVTPIHRAVSTYCIGSLRKWTGLGSWMRLAVLTEHSGALKTSMAILQSHSQYQFYRDRFPSDRRESMDCETWLREPRRPRTAPGQRGGRWMCVVYIPSEQYRGDYPTLDHPRPHATTCGYS
jgi:hypothetical protein